MNQPEQTPLSYVPFGSQYYRAPTPPPEDWEQDLRQFASLGMNTIKIWAQWRWNNPADGEFDFSDLVGLMDVAQELGIRVVVNLILDCAPAWLLRKYPDCRMVTADGRTLGPVTTAYRQIGGVPAHCFHHGGAVKESVQFVEEAARALAGHPALEIWDLWNEPELTVGLLREPKLEDLVCFCEQSRKAFVQWLGRRYEDVGGLNRAWSRNYRSWDEVELPVQPHTYRDFIDWRMFFAATMRQELERRAAAVRAVDSAHPVMCHTVPPPIFHMASCASDDWLLSECGDLHGNSVGSEPFAADLLRSAACGKPVINAETHALPGGTFSRPHPIGASEVKRHVLGPLARGIKGFLFWQYRPERLGAESPAWGLTNPDGSASPWLGQVSRMAKAVAASSSFILSGQVPDADIAILADPENQLFCFAGTLSGDLYARSLRGAYDALFEAGYNIDFVHPRDFETGAFLRQKCIYLPMPYWIEAGTSAKLAEWVRGGGRLISEIWPAAYDSSANMHSAVTPGMGLAGLFGVTETASWPEPSGFDAYRMWDASGPGAGALHMELEEGLSESVLRKARGLRLAVSSYVPTERSTKVLARLPDSGACVVENAYGEGRTILAGAALGYSASFEGGGDARELILAAARRMVGMPRFQVDGPARADVLTSGGKRLLFLSSFSDGAQELTVRLPDEMEGCRLSVGFTDDAPQAALDDGKLVTKLPGRAVEAWWLVSDGQEQGARSR